jgi:biotin operon repressor
MDQNDSTNTETSLESQPTPPASVLNGQMLELLKALADAKRLQIVGLLAGERALSVEQLAASLGLGMSTTSHHLARLERIGLVSSRSHGHYNLYTLHPQVLESAIKPLVAREKLYQLAPNDGEAAFKQKVLATFIKDGRITAFPRQQKKQLIIFEHVLEALFVVNQRYSEFEVNERLKVFSEDTAVLRRSLVDHGMMAREGGGGAYWRIASDDQSAGASAEAAQ